MKNTAVTVRQAKADGSKLTMLTAYDYSIARLADASGVNTILVGDSLGMCMLGYADTIPVTMDEMLHHTKAVVRACENALIIGDMPFMSYQASVYDAVVNAGRLIKEGGAGCVKLEGGAVVAPQIKAIVEAGIPVMGHIGLTPQSVNAFGGFKVQGKETGAAKKMIDDALAIQEAGAFSIVVECVPGGLGTLLTEVLDIPTFGIGAGLHCDGQVQIYQDAVNLYGGKPPKHAKVFGDAGGVIAAAFAAFIAEVDAGTFPTEEQTFKTDPEVLEACREYAKSLK